jgi:hypothetical protein
MISTFTRTARGLRSTLDRIATPCSVNAYREARRRPPQLEITICDSSWPVPRESTETWNRREPDHVALDGLNESSRVRYQAPLGT